MTEQLNYDPVDPNAPEFSEDEQDSLEVAEKLGQEESEIYAGKYENAEQLEEAYLELQRKLGSDDDDEVETKQQENKSTLLSPLKAEKLLKLLFAQDAEILSLIFSGVISFGLVKDIPLSSILFVVIIYSLLLLI